MTIGIFMRKGKRYLSWGFHELAFSLRTSDVECPFFSEEGGILGEIETQKKAGNAEIPEEAKYWLRRYWTNNRYPEHLLYLLNRGDLELIYEIDRNTTLDILYQFKIPEKIKQFLMNDIFD